MKSDFETYLIYPKKLKRLAFKLFGFSYIFCSSSLKLVILECLDVYVCKLSQRYLDDNISNTIDDLLRTKY